jgi:hypothetical protein
LKIKLISAIDSLETRNEGVMQQDYDLERRRFFNFSFSKAEKKKKKMQSSKRKIKKIFLEWLLSANFESPYYSPYALGLCPKETTKINK